MSAFLNATDKLSRTTALVAANVDYSCVFWFRNKSTQGATDYKNAFTFINAGYTAWAGIFAGTGADVNNYSLSTSDGATTVNVAQFITVALNQWYAMAYTRSGNTHNFYADGVLVGSCVNNITAVTWSEEIIGYDGFGINDFDIFGFREFNSALTINQLIAEWNSATPVLTSYASTPLQSDALDISGNGRNWTNTGVTFPSTSPTQVSLTNNGPALPYVITTMPFHGVQVTRTSGGIENVWFQYTAGVNDVVLDYHFYSHIPTISYGVITEAYLGLANVSNFVANNARNAGQQMPVPAGKTLYFQAKSTIPSISADPAVIAFDLFLGPTAPANSNTVFIRCASVSDQQIAMGYTGLFGGFIDIASDQIISFIPQFITGEWGDVLPTTGKMLWPDDFASLAPFPAPGAYNVYLYDMNFNQITSFIFDTNFSGPARIRTHNESDKFYIGSSGLGANKSTFRTVDAFGNLGTLHTLTTAGMSAIAANVAETILYITGVGGTANSNIKRWDIAGGAYLTDLVAAVAGYKVTDILVLSDDSLVVCYFKNTVTRDCFVRRYSSAGATLNTYTLSPFAATLAITNPRLGYARDSPNSFLYFGHLTTFYCDIRQVKVSDGSYINSSLIGDSGQSTVPDVLDAVLPITSDSCPIIQVRAGSTPPITTFYGGLYVIVPGKLNDTVLTAGTTLNLKIPDPTFRTGLVG